MLTYSPGGWHLAVTADAVALLAPEVPAEAVAAVWTSLGRGEGLAAVLDGLVGVFGASLSGLPAFVLASTDGDGVRVIARGPVQAQVTAATVEQIAGHGATTWTERTVRGAQCVELIAESGPDAVLPLRDGVASASRAVWPVSDDVPVETRETTLPDPAATVTHVPAAEPEPEPEHDPEPDLSLEPEPEHDPVPAPEPQGEQTTGYDDLLFGATRMVSVEDAAVRAPESTPGFITGIPGAGTPAAAAVQGDHDGETISSEALAALQAQLPSRGTSAAPELVVSDGQRFTLDRGAVVGRRPRTVRATGTIPHLVAVDSPNQDISRSHVEVRVDGGDVVVVDLNTVNGTRLLREGADPVRLNPGEPSLMVTGDRLDLGEGIVLSFEGV